jgi:NosR/NirI family transcriptional regulator, nitrous oxide reductase regulator
MPTAALARLLLPLILAALALATAGAARAAPAPPFPELFPEATRHEAEPGPPPVVAAYRGDELLGWAFSSREVAGTVGYSGRALDILVGLGADGRIAGARVLSEEEPIFRSEGTRRGLDRFLADHRGRPVDRPLEVDRWGGGGGVQAVSGATVSSLVVSDTVLRAARAVARAKSLLGGGASGGIDRETFAPADWAALVADGSVVQRRFTLGEVAEALDRQGLRPEVEGDPAGLYVELSVALATPPRIGQNLVGQRDFARALAGLGPDDQLVFVGSRGRYSFKGTAWVRSGSFERIALAQGDRTIGFGGGDHVRVEEVRAAGAPELREAALFVVRGASGFRPAEPWRLQLLVSGRDAGGAAGHAVVEVGYRLPQAYVRAAPPAPHPSAPAWREIWLGRLPDLAVLGAALGVLTGVLFFQDQLARRRRAWARLRAAFLAFTLLWIGWYATAQLSIVNVLTFGDALRAGFRWDFFLLEPLVFVLWCYVAATLVLWGRGAFCGWLCPFGALQELANAAARKVGVPQLPIPFPLHERLRSVKFLVFLGLFAVALGSVAQAQRLAEVEPFKTAIVLRFLREPPYVAWALLLLGAGLFVERFFCRYLCPLGAALALPSRLRQFEWLKRHWQCGRECRICQVQCPVQAIQPEGTIHPGECVYCLKCQCNYHDDRLCPPMVERRKRAERRAALAAQPPAANDRAAR